MLEAISCKISPCVSSISIFTKRLLQAVSSEQSKYCSMPKNGGGVLLNSGVGSE